MTSTISNGNATALKLSKKSDAYVNDDNMAYIAVGENTTAPRCFGHKSSSISDPKIKQF